MLLYNNSYQPKEVNNNDWTNNKTDNSLRRKVKLSHYRPGQAL
jgi:hypothetical protein